MKAIDVRKLNKVDLEKKLADLQKKLREHRFNSARGEIKNPLAKKHFKKDIARILTIMREKINEKD